MDYRFSSALAQNQQVPVRLTPFDFQILIKPFFCLKVLASIFLMLDSALDCIDTQYHGVILIADFKGFGFSHARMIGPRRLQNIASLLQV